MTREEAKEVLDDMKVKIDIPKSAVTQHKRNEALDMAISALSENKGEWIPVTERLPEPEDKQEVKVIVSYENEDGEFVEKGVFNKRYGFNFPSVKAWQPLPEPYKPEQEEGAE